MAPSCGTRNPNNGSSAKINRIAMQKTLAVAVTGRRSLTWFNGFTGRASRLSALGRQAPLMKLGTQALAIGTVVALALFGCQSGRQSRVFNCATASPAAAFV